MFSSDAVWLLLAGLNRWIKMNERVHCVPVSGSGSFSFFLDLFSYFPTGPGGPGPAPQRSGSSPSYQSHKMPLPPQYPPSGPPSSQYYKVSSFNSVVFIANQRAGNKNQLMK